MGNIQENTKILYPIAKELSKDFSTLDDKDIRLLETLINNTVETNGLKWGDLPKEEKEIIAIQQFLLLLKKKDPNYLDNQINKLNQEADFHHIEIKSLEKEKERLKREGELLRKDYAKVLKEKVGDRQLLWFIIGFVVYIFLPYNIFLYILVGLFWALVFIHISKNT